jgi:hypothetical protein
MVLHAATTVQGSVNKRLEERGSASVSERRYGTPKLRHALQL